MVKAFIRTQSGGIEIFEEIDFRSREGEDENFEVTNNFEVTASTDTKAEHVFLVLDNDGKIYFSENFKVGDASKIKLFLDFLIKNKICPRGGMIEYFFVEQITKSLYETFGEKFVWVNILLGNFRKKAESSYTFFFSPENTFLLYFLVSRLIIHEER